MPIVKYKNQSGVVYAYEQTSCWDPVKKQSRSKKKCLGRVDPETGEIIPSKRKKKNDALEDAGIDKDNLPEVYTQCMEQLARANREIEKLKADNAELTKKNQDLTMLIRLIHEKTALE